MFTFEIRFFPKTFEEPFIDTFDEAMWDFWAALSINGQILPTNEHTIKHNDHYALRVVAPQMDSLDKKHYNKYCKISIESVTEKSKIPPEIHFIGINYDAGKCCACENPSHYILHIPYGSAGYPVLCGNCEMSVPLHKLPRTYDENQEFHDVLCWWKVYKSCDKQFMVGIGERHAYKMMNDPNSHLSEEGLRICTLWEELVKKPFYYFLFKYYKKNKPTCPKCGENWVNDNGNFNYNYVCEKCRLVSNDL